MVLLPAMVVALFMNPVAGIFMDHVGIRPVMLVLSAFILVGALLEITASESTPLWAMALYQAVRQFGIAGMIGPLQAWTRLAGLCLSVGLRCWARLPPLDYICAALRPWGRLREAY